MENMNYISLNLLVIKSSKGVANPRNPNSSVKSVFPSAQSAIPVREIFFNPRNLRS
jgi:hypothetical protein